MISAAHTCGCVHKKISFPESEGSRKHDKSYIQSTHLDKNYYGMEEAGDSPIDACCCSRQSKEHQEPSCTSINIKNSTNQSSKKLKEKNVSEITRTKLPYKEIEAIINNNRMVLRIQKISIKNEWDPPCDCGADKKSGIESEFGSESSMSSDRYGDDIVFRKAEEHTKPSSIRQEEISEIGGTPRRTITVVSQPHGENGPPDISPPLLSSHDDDKRDKIDTMKFHPRPIDLEENPNLFVLKIRKKSECSEGRESIDLEFRTPRPWLPKPKIVRTVKRPATPRSPTKEQMERNVEDLKSAKGNKKGNKKKGGKKKKK